MLFKVLLATLAAVVSLSSNSLASNLYSVPDKGARQHEELTARGIDILSREADGRLLVVAPATEEAFLSTFGAPVELFAAEGSSVSAREARGKSPEARKDLVGSYAGYHTYAETQTMVQSLAATYPALCELQSMGTSYEGRDIPVLRITNLAPTKMDKPEVLICGNLHARELMSVEIPLLFAEYLLQNYGVDPQVTAMVDTRDIYIAPMMNPDGHVYVENNNADDWWNWWRKNRRPVGGGFTGVDLNRNFSYQWGLNDQGSSGDPSSILYRGPSAFSEPETQALRDFVIAHDFKVAFSYHSYSELLLYPWGYTYDYTVDHELFHTLGQQLTADNGYFAGNPAEGAIYLTNGGSDDWAYGETLTKNSFLCFTPELNSSAQGGFGPVDSYIQPTFDLVLSMNMGLLEIADEPRKVLGPVAPVLNSSPVFAAPVLSLDWSGNVVDDPNPAVGYTVEEFKNLMPAVDAADVDMGLFALNGFTVSTTAFSGAGSYFSGMDDNLANSIETVAPYMVTPSTSTFQCQMRYDIEIDYDYAYVSVSTDGGLIWSTVPGSVTTNNDPNGVNLGNGITGSTGGAWVAATFDLSAYLGQTVAVRIQYITDGSVRGDGLWVDELSPVPAAESKRLVVEGHPSTSFGVSVSETASYSYRVKATDAAGDESRWSNLISLALDPVTAVGESVPGYTHLAGNYPNPFNPRTLVSFEVGSRDGHVSRAVRLDVYDLAGRHVRELVRDSRAPGAYRVTWDGKDHSGSELPSGIYLARLTVDGESTAAKKMTLLR